MKEFKIEIQETLCRVVDINATDVIDAITKIKDMYIKTEIILNYNDLVDVDFIDINSQSKEDEKRNLINEIIEYFFNDEKKHFKEFEYNPKSHIYKKLIRLKELNDQL